ncbi:MAG: succinate dehydrogenase/fumarate reductase iron-sulfur subunit [Opitutales bacterium]
MKINLKIWRQDTPTSKGKFETFALDNVSEDSSFLEMLDILNEKLVSENKDVIAFDHDCREGICGMCSMVINGTAHGPERRTTVCQLHMRKFENGSTIIVEPWRAKNFPVKKDLIVDREAFEEIQRAGGYVSVRTGSPQDANATLIAKETLDKAMDAASCIGCGACVAACPNASAMLFTSAKITQLNLLPQGAPEKDKRTIAMVDKMNELGFGNCTNYGECQGVCPKGITLDNIAKMNRDYAIAVAKQAVTKE